MYLKKTYRKNSGRTYLVIAKKYRDPETGVSKDQSILSLGYLDDLEKEYADPIAHFKGVAREMTEKEKAEKQVTLTFSMDEELAPGTDNRKNYGYAAIMKIYHELLLHEFLAARARHQQFEFNTNSIMLLLVISRILYPGSKKRAFDEKGRYFERFDFELADVYRALSHFAKIGTALQRQINDRIAKLYGRDTSVVYFDVTNFYFEIDEEDDLKRRGVSKEHRPNPIVQMGLAMDNDGIPINYKLFPGNKHDSETFRDIIGEICKNYDTGRIIVVSDMGVISGDNIWYLIGGKPENPKHGYVFSFSVRGGTNEFKKYVLEEAGYLDADGKPACENADFKIKSRRIARQIDVTRSRDGKKMKKTVYEKQIVTWSSDYAKKAKRDRERMISRAHSFIKNPSKYNRHINHGAAKYINGINKDTGEVEEGKLLSFDYEALAEDEKFDGYYAVVTSEHEMEDHQVLEIRKGLWEIEETFGIEKGDLDARPMFLSRNDRIDAHLLICFISLVIIRILQKKTGRAFSAEKLIDAMKRIACTNEENNLYLFDYRSVVTDAIGDAVGVDFRKKRRRLGEIKKVMGDVKK